MANTCTALRGPAAMPCDGRCSQCFQPVRSARRLVLKRTCRIFAPPNSSNAACSDSAPLCVVVLRCALIGRISTRSALQCATVTRDRVLDCKLRILSRLPCQGGPTPACGPYVCSPTSEIKLVCFQAAKQRHRFLTQSQQFQGNGAKNKTHNNNELLHFWAAATGEKQSE